MRPMVMVIVAAVAVAISIAIYAATGAISSSSPCRCCSPCPCWAGGETEQPRPEQYRWLTSSPTPQAPIGAAKKAAAKARRVQAAPVDSGPEPADQTPDGPMTADRDESSRLSVGPEPPRARPARGWASGSSLPLFDGPPPGPPGFHYRSDIVTPVEAADLVDQFQRLPFEPFAFRGYAGNRRTVAYGSRYDFTHSRLHAAEPVPDWLSSLRARAARFAGVEDEAMAQALVTEYPPGAGIGWHRDRPEYGKVVGVSFSSPCTLRLRRRAGDGWRRESIRLEPGSAYLLDGEARDAWQHSIPAGDRLRYSVTFRTLRP